LAPAEVQTLLLALDILTTKHAKDAKNGQG
jgi:hypothetical protein